MSVWDTYERRAEISGKQKRDSVTRRELHFLENNIGDSLSYHVVDIDGEEQRVAIINSDNLNEKLIISMPGEDIRHGGLVHWMDNYWLVTERDANSTLYIRAKMLQCNHVLKWIDKFDRIIQQWSIVEDGTKYLTGEFEDNHFINKRGDSRIAVTVARTKDTAALNRDSRFLIDDDLSEHKLAYRLTKPMKLGWAFNGDGVYKFVMQEVSATDDDNHDLGIADYYKHFPKCVTVDDRKINNDGTPAETKEVWL